MVLRLPLGRLVPPGWCLLLAAAAAALATAGPAAAGDPPSCGSPSASGSTATVNCDYTGAAQSWTVPSGVTSATFDLKGAAGGTYTFNGSGGNGADDADGDPG